MLASNATNNGEVKVMVHVQRAVIVSSIAVMLKHDVSHRQAGLRHFRYR